MSSKSVAGIFAILLTVATANGAASAQPTVESIGDRVMCLCGCVATLNHCPHVNCAMREQMQASIRKDIAAGKDENAILQDLVLQYGVQVLAEPPTKGFNLTAWILPGAGLLAGLAFVVVIVRRWNKPAPPEPAARSAEIDPTLLAAVEDEMKKTTG
jgi:cytochrome c-type biogenesis protein CcmH/NrfF